MENPKVPNPENGDRSRRGRFSPGFSSLCHRAEWVASLALAGFEATFFTIQRRKIAG
jgi:hypothetical protein